VAPSLQRKLSKAKLQERYRQIKSCKKIQQRSSNKWKTQRRTYWQNLKKTRHSNLAQLLYSTPSFKFPSSTLAALKTRPPRGQGQVGNQHQRRQKEIRHRMNGSLIRSDLTGEPLNKYKENMPSNMSAIKTKSHTWLKNHPQAQTNKSICKTCATTSSILIRHKQRLQNSRVQWKKSQKESHRRAARTYWKSSFPRIFSRVSLSSEYALQRLSENSITSWWSQLVK